MGSKSDFPQILQKPARGTSQDDPCQMVRLIWVHVHVFASGRAKGGNTQSPMYTPPPRGGFSGNHWEPGAHLWRILAEAGVV